MSKRAPKLRHVSLPPGQPAVDAVEAKRDNGHGKNRPGGCRARDDRRDEGDGQRQAHQRDRVAQAKAVVRVSQVEGPSRDRCQCREGDQRHQGGTGLRIKRSHGQQAKTDCKTDGHGGKLRHRGGDSHPHAKPSSLVRMRSCICHFCEFGPFRKQSSRRRAT
jgi:hypothetical protein